MIVVTCLAIMLWPLRLFDLVLYLWNLRIYLGPSSYWCGALVMIYVSSWIICGYLCGRCLVAQPGLIKTVTSCIVL